MTRHGRHGGKHDSLGILTSEVYRDEDDGAQDGKTTTLDSNQKHLRKCIRTTAIVKTAVVPCIDLGGE